MTDLNKCETLGNGVTTFSEEVSVARIEEEMKLKLYATQTIQLQDSMRKFCNTAWRKCTEHLKARIKESDKH